MKTTKAAVMEPKPPAWTRGAGRNQAGHKVTTVRFTPEQWTWLRDAAHARAVESGGKADASEIVRALVDAAMKKTSARKG